jgi:hypothetical protein
LTEQVGKSLLKGFEVLADSCPDHNAIGIEWLAMLAIALSGPDRTVEAVFGE